MGQITAPIIAITLVLLSVFVPVAFIPGISGQLYQQFAVAVAVSMVISAINALTLSPALVRVLLQPPCTGPSAARCATCWAAIDLARDGYAAVVKRLVRVAVIEPRRARRRRSRSMAGCSRSSPTGFLPAEDQGAFFVEVQLPEGASVNRTAVRGRAGREASSRTSRASPTSARSSATASLDGLSEVQQRLLHRAAQAVRGAHDRRWRGRASIIAKVRAEVQAIREANVIPFNLPPIIGLGTGGGFEYQLLRTCRAAIPPTSPPSRAG